MAEIRSGILNLLARPWVYDSFQTLVGANAWRERVVREMVSPKLPRGAMVVDVGCGTGWVLNYLPADVQYAGIDRNPAYIAEARERFAHRAAEFHCEDISGRKDSFRTGADVVLAIGLLHHLNDQECGQLVLAAARILKPEGFLLTLDPLYCDDQSAIARAIIRRDRGRNIRTAGGYRDLLSIGFPRVDVLIERSPLRIPYTGVVCSARA